MGRGGDTWAGVGIQSVCTGSGEPVQTGTNRLNPHPCEMGVAGSLPRCLLNGCQSSLKHPASAMQKAMPSETFFLFLQSIWAVMEEGQPTNELPTLLTGMLM